MHATIVAFSSHVAVIPAGYSKKFIGLFKSLDYDHVLDFRTFNTEQAVKFTLNGITERENLKQETEYQTAIIDQTEALGKVSTDTLLIVVDTHKKNYVEVPELLEETDKVKSIVTSNIPADGVYLQTKYRDLLNQEEAVSDNAGLMAIKFLSCYGAKKIYLAGFDGYSHDVRENYGNSEMAFMTRNAVLDAMNVGIVNITEANITGITPALFNLNGI